MKRTDIDLDDVKNAAGVASDRLGVTASAVEGKLSDAPHATSARAKGLAARVKASVDEQRVPKQPPIDLTALPPAAKLLYCRALVAQARVDGDADPRELANLYLFASTIGLDAASRTALRSEIGRRRAGGRPDAAADDVLALVGSVSELLWTDRRDAVLTMLLRDLLRMSRADRTIGIEERNNVLPVAELVFPGHGGAVISHTEKMLDAEEDFLAGRISSNQLTSRSKDIVAGGVAIGVPIAAISTAGTVSGLGAAGITSGLAALGFGGLLGFSAMVTGIGTVVILGVAVHQGTKFVLNARDREKEPRREALIQEVLKHHQDAIADLTADIADLAARMDAYLDSTERNEERLAHLRAELAAFNQALADLQASHDQFVRQEPVRVG